MGNLILTSSKKISHPYFSTELGIHIYSAEELSYFIYNNLMLLDESFLDERLTDFLANELDMAETAEKLVKWRESSDFGELLLVILQDAHYYNAPELMRFSEELARLKREGAESIYLEKGDYLFSIGKYYAALNIYNKLLSGRNGIMAEKPERAKVHEHAGFVLARLFAYDKALGAFQKAYKNNPLLRYQRDIYFIHKLRQRKKEPPEIEDIISETREKWDAEYEAANAAGGQDARVIQVNELLEKDEIKKQKGLTSLIYKLKEEYKRSQG